MSRTSPRPTAATTRALPADTILGPDDTSLLDVVDNVLSKGVVLTGDITIALANVDLIYARLSLLLCAADRVLPQESPDAIERHRVRHARRERSGGRDSAVDASGRGPSIRRSRG